MAGIILLFSATEDTSSSLFVQSFVDIIAKHNK